MEEGDGGREGVVVIDDVGEVGHRLVAFIEGCFQFMFVGGGRSGRIDDVECPLPATCGYDALVAGAPDGG